MRVYIEHIDCGRGLSLNKTNLLKYNETSIRDDDEAKHTIRYKYNHIHHMIMRRALAGRPVERHIDIIITRSYYSIVTLYYHITIR